MVRALYVDLNSFFASCEQQLQPHLRGKPVAIVPMLADTTSVIAASYEAKAFGIKTGTRVYDAKKMCPGLHFVAAFHKPYIEFHHKVKTAIDTVIPIHAVRSIDEFACELTGSQQQEDKAIAIAHKIKQALHSQVGEYIKASIGLAPNFLLAKIAADMKKPDGLTLINSENLKSKLITLKLQDIPGIGPNMDMRLQTKGITTVEQLLACSEQTTKGLWENIWGSRMHKLLHGEWIDFLSPSEVKSIGHQHVLPPLKRNYEGAQLVGQKLLWKAAVRLRENLFLARRLLVSIRYLDGDRFTQEISMNATQDSGQLLQHFNSIYKHSPKNKKPRKMSITLSDFISENQYQLSFFEQKNKTAVYKAVDALNQKYGKNTIIAGSLLEHKETAPTRIAFQRIPQLNEVEDD